MLDFLHARQREEEWMDARGVDPEQLRRSLRFIRRINSFLGYRRLSLKYFKRFSRGWNKRETVSILDVATGSGDIPAAIQQWARSAGFKVEIMAADLHGETIRVAARESNGIQTLQADARLLPFSDKSVDYVHTAMFIHHLDEPDVVRVLKEMNRIARRGIIVTDLIRTKRAYAWISLFTLLANPMVIHDAKVSVAQAFTQNEMEALCRSASIGYAKYRRHFGHRFVIAGEKKADHVSLEK